MCVLIHYICGHMYSVCINLLFHYRNLVPQNIIQACFQHIQTKVEMVNLNTTTNATKMPKTLEYVHGMNIIGKSNSALNLQIVFQS